MTGGLLTGVLFSSLVAVGFGMVLVAMVAYLFAAAPVGRAAWRRYFTWLMIGFALVAAGSWHDLVAFVMFTVFTGFAAVRRWHYRPGDLLVTVRVLDVVCARCRQVPTETVWDEQCATGGGHQWVAVPSPASTRQEHQ